MILVLVLWGAMFTFCTVRSMLLSVAVSTVSCCEYIGPHVHLLSMLLNALLVHCLQDIHSLTLLSCILYSWLSLAAYLLHIH